MKTHRIIFGIIFAAICIMQTGCTALVGTYHTNNDMKTADAARNAGFKVGFDPDARAVTIEADLWDIVSNLYQNHLPSTLTANAADIIGGYFLGKNIGMWGDNGGGDSASAKPLNYEWPTSNGRDTIVVQGNNNTLDTSTGHNTSDNHSTPLAP